MKNPYLLGISITVICVSIAALIYDAAHHDHNEQTHNEHDNHVDEDTHVSTSSSRHNHNHEKTVPGSGLPGQSIAPIPHTVEVDHRRAKIGWVLFKDPNLSSNQTISCESCHNLTTNGAEQTPNSTGVNGIGRRNSLTVFNAIYNYRFFWDGRVNNLSDQIDGPIHDVMEMDSNWEYITQYVAQSDQYTEMFANVKTPITQSSIKSMLIEFMGGLTTPDSPFDLYLQGDRNAINESAKRGWQTFQDEGCIRCHQGTNIGGGMVMRFGYFGLSQRGTERSEDTGRHVFTGQEKDKHLFRVASLRNVAITPPYFHDGQTQTLEEAINIMAASQLGVTLDSKTIIDIKTFLESLTGNRPKLLEVFENE